MGEAEGCDDALGRWLLSLSSGLQAAEGSRAAGQRGLGDGSACPALLHPQRNDTLQNASGEP